jgi:hypothetical protein
MYHDHMIICTVLAHVEKHSNPNILKNARVIIKITFSL